MNENLHPRDLETLSAYLDGALDGPAAARLQTRLAAEPQLAAALRRLEQVRGWLRAAPQRRLPRGFTLSPTTAAELRPARSSFGAWRLLSAAASFLLVAVLVGQFLPGGQLLVAAHAEAPAESLMMEVAPAAEEATGEAAGEPAPAAPGLAVEEDDAPRMSTPPATPAPETQVSQEQALAGLALLAAFSGLMAWRQWRRLPDR